METTDSPRIQSEFESCKLTDKKVLQASMWSERLEARPGLRASSQRFKQPCLRSVPKNSGEDPSAACKRSPILAIRRHKVTLPAEAVSPSKSEKQNVIDGSEEPQDLKSRMAVLLASLVLPALHFASCSLTSLSPWTRLGLHGPSLQHGDLVHMAWFIELLAVSLIGVRFILQHGLSLKLWTWVAWGGLCQSVSIVSFPISWSLVCLYFQAVLEPQMAPFQEDIALVVLILPWALTLTINLETLPETGD